MSKLKKTQSSSQISNSGSNKINHTNVKRNTEQPSISTNLSSSSIPISSSPRSPLESLTSSVQTSNSGSGTVISSSPVKSPGTATSQPRRKRLKTDRSLLKDREYDPDRHCGVWNEETGKPCTRSLTCKAHTVSLRRTVIGRSKTFDKLLAEHRASKEVPNRPTKVTVTGTVTVSSGTSNLNPLTPTNPALTIEAETPSSPPVLSLPDTYPLPKVRANVSLYCFSLYFFFFILQFPFCGMSLVRVYSVMILREAKSYCFILSLYYFFFLYIYYMS